eukprot:COSAG01_NODE_13656_length_1552_cov_10.807295_2_plen_85_part_01
MAAGSSQLAACRGGAAYGTYARGRHAHHRVPARGGARVVDDDCLRCMHRMLLLGRAATTRMCAYARPSADRRSMQPRRGARRAAG